MIIHLFTIHNHDRVVYIIILNEKKIPKPELKWKIMQNYILSKSLLTVKYLWIDRWERVQKNQTRQIIKHGLINEKYK